MMRKLTATPLLILCLVALPGCISPQATTEGGQIEPASASGVTVQPIKYEGQTGMTACIEPVITLVCPVAGRGPNDLYVFECADGLAEVLEGNVSWDAVGTPPPEFNVALAHAPKGGDWRAEVNDSWRSTTSPIHIYSDLTLHPGEQFGLSLYAWRVAVVQGVGARADAPEDFRFDGTITCEEGAFE